MYYSHKNCEVLIDNMRMHVNNATISLNASITPTIYNQRSAAEYYVPKNGLRGSLKISYYLTGRDYIKDYITDDTRFINCNFGGLYVKSGCLSSYSINGQPNSPINAEAEILFFEDLKGSFTPSYAQSQPNLPLNFSDCLISGLTGNSKMGDLSNIRSFSFTSFMDVNPNYIDSNQDQKNGDYYNITFGSQQSTLDINYDNLTGQLPFSGSEGGVVAIYFRNSGLNIFENISVSGKIFQKEISISPNSAITSKVSIIQDSILPIPTIASFSPLSGTGNTPTLSLYPVIIAGSGLKTTSHVYYGENLMVKTTVLNDNQIRVYPYRSPSSGFFRIVTRAGVAVSTTPFIIRPLSIVF